MMVRLRELTAALVLGAMALTSTAQAEPIEFYQLDAVPYDESIPTPEEHFGFGVGDRPVRHDLMVSYLRELAELSDRISVETIGYSHEGRPILFFVVTSPENHARIEDIREDFKSKHAED